MIVSDGDGELIPLLDAVRESGISRATIYRWIEAGKLTLAPKVPHDQRTMLYRAEFLRAAAEGRRRRPRQSG